MADYSRSRACSTSAPASPPRGIRRCGRPGCVSRASTDRRDQREPGWESRRTCFAPLRPAQRLIATTTRRRRPRATRRRSGRSPATTVARRIEDVERTDRIAADRIPPGTRRGHVNAVLHSPRGKGMTATPGESRRLLAAACLAVAIVCAGALAAAARSGAQSASTLGHSTLEQRIVPGAGAGFRTLGLGAGESRMQFARKGSATPRGGREGRRRSLLYLGQLSDFQLADEESPTRVEFADNGPASAAWRPSEAIAARKIDDAMIRQLNAFAAAGPNATGDGTPEGDGPGDQHRRHRRQPAAQRDRVGAGADGGRAAQARAAASIRRAPTTSSAPASRH